MYGDVPYEREMCVRECGIHPKFTPQPNHTRETWILERHHLGQCVCVYVCVDIYIRSYITHFNLTGPYGDEEKGYGSRCMHQISVHRKMDKKRRVRVRIRWLPVYIKRKNTKRINGIGRTDMEEGHPERGI